MNSSGIARNGQRIPAGRRRIVWQFHYFHYKEQPMKRIMKSIALALAVATVPSALAQTLSVRHPMAEKYRDAGTKPAAGRSGSAGIEARALIDSVGVTDVEVTTGHFDALGGGGTLAKVQVKLLAPNGDVMQTDNYRKTLAGNGYASFTYDNMRRGHMTQVQASVTGIDPNRTDVVTVSTPVMLRPDIEAVSVSAPGRVVMNSGVVVSGLMSETNGDVGARATCRLLVDGVEVAAMPGAWIDAASAVTCRFDTSFASVGTKQLTLRVTDVEPADFDPANNEVSRSIEVVAPQPFSYMFVDAYKVEWSYRTHFDQTFTRNDGVVSRATGDSDIKERYQRYMAYAEFPESSPLDAGRIILSHVSDGNVLPTIVVDVADLQDTGGCRNGNFSGVFVGICSSDSFTIVSAGREAGEAVYTIQRGTNSGPQYGWWSNFDFSGTSSSYGGAQDLGSTYAATLRHEVNGTVHEGQLEVILVQVSFEVYADTWSTPECWTRAYDGGVENGCVQQTVYSRDFEGFDQRF